MTDTKHTPGPWRAQETAYKPWTHIVSEQGSFIADTDRHNARLIAASPETLAALEELVEAVESFALSRFEMDGIDTLICKTVRSRAAIAKATGK